MSKMVQLTEHYFDLIRWNLYFHPNHQTMFAIDDDFVLLHVLIEQVVRDENCYGGFQPTIS